MAAPAAAAGGTFRPGELGDGQREGWDLVASQSNLLGVVNASGWSQDEGVGGADPVGYAVLDPNTFTSGNKFGVVSLDTGDYRGQRLRSISALSVKLRTVGAGHAPTVALRVDGVQDAQQNPITCRIYFDVQELSADFKTYDLMGAVPANGGWTDNFGNGCGDKIGSGRTWAQVLRALPANARIGGGVGAPGVSVTTGSVSAGGFAAVNVDSFTFNADVSDFEAPTLTLTGSDQTVEAGQSVVVPVAVGDLSGPNQPTIENNANFLTGDGGLVSTGQVTVTSSTPGLCEATGGVYEFGLEPLHPTRVLGGLFPAEDIPVQPEQATVNVTVTTSATNEGGVGVSQGGTCVVSWIGENSAPAGEFTVTVDSTAEFRDALPLPDDVPADTKALTVTPVCVVAGDALKVTAPAGSFSPDSPVSLGLYGSLIDLGVVTADAEGGLSVEVVVPVGVPDGQHELLAVGYASVVNDDPVYLSAQFEVGTCADAGAGGGIPSGIPAGDGGQGIGGGLLGTGLALLFGAGGALLLRWRRTIGS